mmetsp:Transcript_23163/g.39603  ORF Transcript_23163/g.39603 Transcript_23163/m.39603 type:complete len:278 (-) Transcript_23163:2633-3466(-)
MLFRGEVPLHRADQADAKEDRADDHVEAVKTRGHKEVREELVAAKLPALFQKVAVFVALQSGKEDTQHDTDGQTVDQVLAVVFMHQRVVRPCDRATGQQQHQRVDQGQVQRVDLIELWRDIGAADIVVHRIDGMLEKRPEPRGKEHHFGHNKEDETIAQTDPHDGGVISDMAFVDHVSPPAEHDIQHADKAHEEHPGAAQLDGFEQDGHPARHPDHTAKQHDECSQCAQERPGGWRQNVVVVIFSVGHGPSLSSGWYRWPGQGRHSPRAGRFGKRYS